MKSNAKNASTIVFIGGGNMATALISGLAKNDYPPKQIWATDLSTEKLGELNKRFDISTTTNNKTAAAHADILVLAVKPQSMKSVLAEIAPAVCHKNPLIISVAAGVCIEHIGNYLKQGLVEGQVPVFCIVRAMPNTPALINAGATALHANIHVTPGQKQDAEHLMRTVGLTLWLENEADLDVVTALSGSGPAYFFYMMEALEKAAVAAGLPADTAHTLTLQTALGAARLALQSETSLTELRNQVTSRGGTTEAALNLLENRQTARHFEEALLAATRRAKELGEVF